MDIEKQWPIGTVVKVINQSSHNYKAVGTVVGYRGDCLIIEAAESIFRLASGNTDSKALFDTDWLEKTNVVSFIFYKAAEWVKRGNVVGKKATPSQMKEERSKSNNAVIRSYRLKSKKDS